MHVYFLRGEHAAVVLRPAPSRTPATAAVRALLRGPTAAERGRGLSTAVPRCTVVRGLSVRNGLATVDLTRTFASGGGTSSMQARLFQLVYTVTAVRGVDRVVLQMSGATVRVFSGEGLILDQPLTRRSVAIE